MISKKEILKMRKVLVKRRDALRKALADDISSLNELRAQKPGDTVDAALDSDHDEISSQMAEAESRELVLIENALERMNGEFYGVCEGCGNFITVARLSAMPYATLCITCQYEAEREAMRNTAESIE